MRSPPAYVGLDVGSSRVKAMAWQDGQWGAVALRATPWEGPHRSWLNPERLLETAIDVIQEAVSAVGAPSAAAVAVAGMAEAGTYTNAKGEPLGPIVGWQDVEATTPLFGELLAQWNAETLYRRTGMPPAPKFGVLRMAAQRPLGPEPVFWLQVADWIVYRLTGRRVTHASLAARTMAYDVRREGWDPELLAFAHGQPAMMPEIVWRPTAVPVKNPAPACCAGASIVPAGHDHAVAAFGADLRQGQCLNSTGTAETLLTARPHLFVEQCTPADGIACAPAVALGPAWIAMADVAGGGMAEQWARALLAVGDNDHPLSGDSARYVVQGFAEGGAAWRDMTALTTAGNLYAAVLDAVAADAQVCLERMESRFGPFAGPIRLTGGVVHHRRWLQLRRRRMARPLEVMDPAEGVLVGAVRWAAAALGEPMLPAPQWVLIDDTA
jgi:sugar (pentulose or hexulose) kinase